MPMKNSTIDTTLEFRPTLKATDDLIKNLVQSDGQNLSDTIFFSKLQELRREHKRSLKLMEDLYKETLLEKTAVQKRSRSAIGRRDSSRVNEEDFVNFLTHETRQAYLESRRRGEPAFRLSSDDQDGQFDSESVAGSYISDSYFPQDWENMSLQEVLRSARSALSDSDDSDPDQADQKSARQFRRHSEHADIVEMAHWGDEWKPKITVPVPFRMTIRQETAPIKASYSQNFLHQLIKEQEQKEALEKAKLIKGFRAKPVPATTYLPLYEEMLKKTQERRQFLHDFSREMLTQKLQPFNLTNGQQHRRRCMSTNDLVSDPNESDVKIPIFKAKPAPTRVLDTKIEQEIKEREQKKQRRSEELLRNSKWPTNMQALNRSEIKQALQSRKRHEKLCVSNGWTFTPQITRKIPDFNSLHEEFQRTLEDAKIKGSRVTVPEPFPLKTISKEKKQEHYEKHKNAVKKHHNAARLRSRSMGNLSEKSIVAKPNTAALLREAATKRQLNEMNQQNRKLLQHTRRKDVDEAKMKERMRSKLIDYDLSREAKERERAEQRKSANESSQSYYEQFKRAISEKISDRQSLLDRQNMLLAKQSIEKRYRKALESAGLKGTSVTTAMSSIEKLLAQDKEAADTVSAVIDRQQSIDDHESIGTRSVRSPSSESVQSDASRSATEESVSKSQNTVTVISKSPIHDDARSSVDLSDHEGMQNIHSDHIESQDNTRHSRRASDVKDIFDD